MLTLSSHCLARALESVHRMSMAFFIRFSPDPPRPKPQSRDKPQTTSLNRTVENPKTENARRRAHRIFRPVQPHIVCCGYVNCQGVFLKRQQEAPGLRVYGSFELEAACIPGLGRSKLDITSCKGSMPIMVVVVLISSRQLIVVYDEYHHSRVKLPIPS